MSDDVQGTFPLKNYELLYNIILVECCPYAPRPADVAATIVTCLALKMA